MLAIIRTENTGDEYVANVSDGEITAMSESLAYNDGHRDPALDYLALRTDVDLRSFDLIRLEEPQADDDWTYLATQTYPELVATVLDAQVN